MVPLTGKSQVGATGAFVRSRQALTAPPPDLAGFPRASLPLGDWFRPHRERSDEDASDKGCWWFASVSLGAIPGGRFDLPAPKGTCYFASSPEIAARERLRRFVAERSWVPADAVEGCIISVVSTLHLRNGPLADLTHPTATDRFGITRDISTTSDYALSSQWATSLSITQYGGVLYEPRFTPGEARAVAVFGAAGGRSWRTAGYEPLADVVERMELKSIPTPESVVTDDEAMPEVGD